MIHKREYLDIVRGQDAALEQIELILYKMERLAIRAAKDPADRELDRVAAQRELECLRAELDRVAEALRV